MPDELLRCQPTQRRGFVGLGVRNCVAMLAPMEAVTTVWLAKPDAPRGAESVDVMRWAIAQDGARPGSLIGECLEVAQARGLSEEETYVFLAYQALLRLEEAQQRHLYLSDIAPFVEGVAPQPAAPARKAPRRMRMRVKRLARSAVKQALRFERAVAELVRIARTQDSRLQAPMKAQAAGRVHHTPAR